MLTTTILAAVLGLATPPTSQPEVRTPPPPAGDAPAGILAGPKVDDEAMGSKSLTRTTFDGKLITVDGPAPVAALKRLDLDDATRAAIDAVIAEREGLIDRTLLGDLPAFLALRTQFEAARNGTVDRAEMRTALEAFRTMSAPIRARGSLREEIARALPETARAEFDRMLDDYAAARQKAQARQRDQDPAASDRPVRRRRPGQSTGRRGLDRTLLDEFRASYERTIQMGAQDFRARLDAMDLDPDLKERLKTAVRESALDGTGRRGDLSGIRKLLQELDPADRRAVMKALRETRDG